MIHHIDLTHHQMLAVSRTALAALRRTIEREAGPAAASWLQEAGYAGGDTLFESFRLWLRAQGKAGPEELELGEFQHRASLYFRELGWGTVAVNALNGAVVAVDSSDWHEADPASGDILTAGLEDYRIPGIADTPNIDVHFDEAGFDHVLGGSVGIGEVATVPTSPAIANAIRNAIGVRAYELPIRPARLIAILNQRSVA